MLVTIMIEIDVHKIGEHGLNLLTHFFQFNVLQNDVNMSEIQSSMSYWDDYMIFKYYKVLSNYSSTHEKSY